MNDLVRAVSFVQMHAPRDQRNVGPLHANRENLTAVPGHGRGKESTQRRGVHDAVGLSEGDGPLLPARAEHDRYVVRIDAALFAQLVGGLFGEFVRVRHY